jgi:chromosome segregation ATPase
MRKNILAIALLLIGTTAIWTVICWHWFGKPVAKNTTTEVQKQDSIINYNAGEYDRLLQEQIELYKELRTYEDAQSKAKTTYQRTRDIVIVRDTINRVDVITLINSCDSVINNLQEQINIKDEKTKNLQETVGAYEQKTVLLNEEINTLNTDKKKLEKQKKRRTGALVVASSVAILSTFVLSVLL